MRATTHNSKRAVALLTAMALILAACGSSSSDAGGTDSGADTATATTSAAADGSSDTTEAMEGGAQDDAMADADTELVESVEEPSATSTTGVPATQVDRAAEELAADDAAAKLENNQFQDYGIRSFISASQDPLSTFALDVDSASFNVSKTWLANGQRPDPASVRVEEFVNAFRYDYQTPADGLAISVEGGPSLYSSTRSVVAVGVQSEFVANADRPAASLTFVIDVSGSMDRENRLGLVKRSLSLLVQELDDRDQVSVVVYGDRAEVILNPTPISESETILDAISGLRSTGATNFEAGLDLGYQMAELAFVPGGINRVILASDGVGNVGESRTQPLIDSIRDDADRGIQLLTIGVGMGNFNDVVMEQLANNGDGFYAYIDSDEEGRELFADNLVSTLLTVALDAKIQVEFDPDTVAEYRLLGYENRAVLDQDFRNDEVDAGELGAGHQSTAIYELKLVEGASLNSRIGTVMLRWEDPETGAITEIDEPISTSILESDWNDTSSDFRLAAASAGLAEVLRNSPHTGDLNLMDLSLQVERLDLGNQGVELVDMINSAALLVQ